MTAELATAPAAAPDAPAGISIERVDTPERFAALRGEWDHLYAGDPEAQFFLSSTFLAGAFDMFPGRWIVLVARTADGRMAALMPLSWKLVWSDSRRQLRNEFEAGGRLLWADYVGLLCLPEHEESAIAAITEAIKRLNWSRFSLKGLRASDRRFGLFIGAFVEERFAIEARGQVINGGTTDNFLCPAIALPDSYDAYLMQRLRRNTREQVRRALRRFEADDALTMSVADATTRDRDVAAFVRLWAEMWRETKGAKTDRIAAQYGRVITRGIDDGSARVSVLWRADAPLGVIVNFVDPVKREVLFFVSARDRTCDDVNIGKIMHVLEIRWAIDQGMRRYDFLRGNEPYKYVLGGTHRRLRYPLIRTQTGTNLGGRLEPASIGAALRIAQDFAAAGRLNRAKICCRQILATAPDHPAAAALLAKVIAAQ